MACQDPKRPDGKLPEVPGRETVARGFVKRYRRVPGRKLTAIKGKIGWQEEWRRRSRRRGAVGRNRAVECLTTRYWRRRDKTWTLGQARQASKLRLPLPPSQVQLSSFPSSLASVGTPLYSLSFCLPPHLATRDTIAIQLYAPTAPLPSCFIPMANGTRGKLSWTNFSDAVRMSVCTERHSIMSDTLSERSSCDWTHAALVWGPGRRKVSGQTGDDRDSGDIVLDKSTQQADRRL